MQRLRTYSEYFLYVGLIGLAVPLLVYLLRRQFTLGGQLVLVVGVLSLGVYVGLEYPRILRALGGRQARYGGNALLMTVLFIGIIALLAFLSQRYSKRIDLTANRSFSVSQQTRKVLDNLDRPVKIVAFYSPQSYSRQTVEPLLKSYVAQSNKISYEMIDLEARPTLAAQYGLASGETDLMLLQSGDRQQKVTGTTESDITNGLLKLMSDRQKVVYLLTGHGEYSPEDTGQTGILMAKQALERDNYTVRTLNLSLGAGSTLTTTTGVVVTGTGGVRAFAPVPEDAAAIIIASPKVPIPDGEWQVLSQWLRNGGKLFLMVDALGSASGLEDMLLAEWGITVRNDLVIDLLYGSQSDAAVLIIQRGQFSPITKDLRAEIIMPGARSLTMLPDFAQQVTFTPLAETSQQSWGETDLANLSRGANPEAGKDTFGPLTVAATAERDAPAGKKARLVISGNTRFATDRYINLGGNLDFFLNTVNWLTEDEQLISIRPRPMASRTLFIPPTQSRLIAAGVLGGLPLLVLGLGAIVWWRRR